MARRDDLYYGDMQGLSLAGKSAVFSAATASYGENFVMPLTVSVIDRSINQSINQWVHQ